MSPSTLSIKTGIGTVQANLRLALPDLRCHGERPLDVGSREEVKGVEASMSDVMQVRLHLSGVRVLEVLADTVDRLEIEVESAREWSRCRHCGFKCRLVWDRRAKRVRNLEVSGRRTTLVWRRRRFEYGNCGERHLEDHAQFQAGLTRRFACRLMADG